MKNTQRSCRIDFTDDLMVLLDADGHGLDACRVSPDDADDACRRIDEWARKNSLNAATAKRMVRILVRAMR